MNNFATSLVEELNDERPAACDQYAKDVRPAKSNKSQLVPFSPSGTGTDTKRLPIGVELVAAADIRKYA